MTGVPLSLTYQPVGMFVKWPVASGFSSDPMARQFLFCPRVWLRMRGVLGSDPTTANSWSRPRRRDQCLGATCHRPNSLQIVSHDRPRRRAASDLPEARMCERRGRAGKNVRRAVRYIGIYWIGLERCRPGALGGLQRREHQVCHDALPAVAPAHEETRDRPDRRCVHALEPPHVVKPGYCIARRELTPANGQVAVESEQPRRKSATDDVS